MNREETVLFFKDIYRTLQAIPDADAGILMRALFAIANGEAPDLSGSVIAAGIFPIAADQMKRLEEYRRKQAAKRNKREQNGTNAEQNGSPYPYPYPRPNNITRNPKIHGFANERDDVDRNALMWENIQTGWAEGKAAE